MFIGQGAGKEEDINMNPRNTNRAPFVGKSGRYLRQIISHMWNNGAAFNIALSNTVRCHPRNQYGKDREPTRQEEQHCRGWLNRDIALLNPSILITVGLSSTRSILEGLEEMTMGRIHGRLFRAGDQPVIPTYHPSYLARSYGTFKPHENNAADNYVIGDIRRALQEAAEESVLI